MLVSAQGREREGLVVVASVCVMLGVFFKRAWLLFSSFNMVNVSGGSGIISGSTETRLADGSGVWALTGSYAQTIVEVLIVLAVLSFCVLAIGLISKKLLKPVV